MPPPIAQKRPFSKLTTNASISKDFFGINTSIEGSFQQSEADPTYGVVDAASLQSFGGGMSLAMGVEFVNVTLKGTYTSFTTYGEAAVPVGDPPTEEGGEQQTANISADGDEILFAGGLNFTPVAWLTLSANYNYADRVYVVNSTDPTVIEAFQTVAPTNTTDSIFVVTLTKSF